MTHNSTAGVTIDYEAPIQRGATKQHKTINASAVLSKATGEKRRATHGWSAVLKERVMSGVTSKGNEAGVAVLTKGCN